MASDGDRPRLPDTDDPFVLLGIDEAADDKQVRQAYARLIRIYRPDRSPSEFQRVHAAFELIKHARQGDVPIVRFEHREAVTEAPKEPVRDAANPRIVELPDHDPTDAAAAIARELRVRLDEAVRAHEANDLSAATTIVEELLDKKIPLDLLFRDNATRDVVLRSVRLTWSRLVRISNHHTEVVAAWRAAWDDAFARDLDVAQALLDDDRLMLDAADDPELAGMCLRRIGALGWRKNYNADGLLAKYSKALPSHGYTDWLLDNVAVELAATASLRNQRELRGLFDQVRELLIAARVGTHEECKQAAQQLYERLADDPDVTLKQLDEVARSHDLGPLFELIYGYLPASFTALEAIPKPRFDLLSGTLFDAGHRPHRWKMIGGAGGFAVVAGFAVGMLPTLGIAAAAAGVGLAMEGRRYKKEIRPRIARAILALPVTTGVIARWVRLNSRLAGRLSRFDIGIENDSALYSFSMFVALASAVTSEE